MAQNVIVPIIDLTAAAEGTTVPELLQTSIAFGSQTAVLAQNGTVVAANTTGFWRLIGVAAVEPNSGVANSITITMTDGLSVKTVWGLQITNTSPNGITHEQVDLTFWLAAGESVSVVSTRVDATFNGSIRQIGDSNGVLVNPSGFSPQ